ncbi:C-GCAxxG-C-C family (seleno)protein [Carboxylicivirga sp. RSCT41]|uniref:C-GCAxxG-C-C family (seleno)protein n=1 Tax=Carboxylicivirga agarovorans TaxID=3417570 RepID=UPI003D350C4A
MKIKQALELFHGKEMYNCAQAIFKTFQAEFNTSEQIIYEARRKGGGRAENGYCGALYAAQQLLDNTPQLDTLNAAFEMKGGSRRCREIKRTGKLSCKQCVALAATVVQDSLSE